MVDYIPLSRRRRNAMLVALATLVVGLVVGIVVGRTTAITRRRQPSGPRKATPLAPVSSVTIEYDQAIAGTGDSVQAGVLDALDLVEADMDKLIADSPWLGSTSSKPFTTTAAVRRRREQDRPRRFRRTSRRTRRSRPRHVRRQLRLISAAPLVTFR